METPVFKLDRTAFKAGNHQQNGNQFLYWQSKSMTERLQAAAYLNSVAYNYDLLNPPRLDRTAFSMRKQD
ncbi:hypothetical protein J2I47_24945 [Fibrella sp. HMF5335]|uniref:Uncharacterized protein n=1 Tax=Fibrella rubiginis TaxID=2817060 RepID=A0A939GN18_9BACT|nr:hypothetical protein [Fibrella rubiginis]MBO0939816.1 hypothetical protein [Fibrella rubiginis]